MVNWEKRTQNEPKRTQNEPNFKKAKMNVTSYITKGYENISNWAICENEPNQTQNKPNFRGKNMLLRMKINPRPKSLGYYAGQIQALNACDREKAGNRIKSISSAGFLHFIGQTAKICFVIGFDRLIVT